MLYWLTQAVGICLALLTINQGGPGGKVRWSSPVVIAEAEDNLLRDPRLSGRDDMLYLVINQQRRDQDGRLHPQDVLVTKYSNGGWGRLVNISQSESRSFNPVATVDNRGYAHVVWGELAEPTSDGFPSHIYYANDVGGQWNTPVDLFEDADGRSLDLPMNVSIDANGTVQFAVGGNDGVDPQVEMLFFKVKTDPIDAITVDLSNNAPGVAPFVHIKGETAMVTWLAGYVSPDHPRDSNSVIFSSSQDEGKTWGEPQLVSLSGLKRAYDPRLVITPNGMLHIVWEKDLTGDFFSDAVWHSFSDDGGRTWSEPEEVFRAAENQIIGNVSFVCDEMGRLHLAFDRLDWRTRIADVLVMSQNDGQWQGAQVVDEGAQPTLAVSGHRLHLVYHKLTDNPESEGARLYQLLHRSMPLPSATGAQHPEVFGRFSLSNYPNPFTHATTITYTAPRSGMVNLYVFSVSGRQVRQERLGVQPQGPHQFRFDAGGLPAGVYFYEVCVGMECRRDAMVVSG